MSNEKRPSFEAVLVAEYRLLNALVRKPEYFNDSRVSSNVFVDETAKSIFEGIESLYERGIPCTEASLTQSCNEIDYNVTSQEIKKVLSIDIDGADTIDDIIPVLNNEITKKNIIEKITNLKKLTEKDGLIDVNTLQAQLFEIEKDVKNANNVTTDVLSVDEMFDEYNEDLERRRTGIKYSFGDYNLNEHIIKGALPGRITAIVAATSMGKSTFGLNMISNLMNEGSPCMYVSLEMGMLDTVDRLLINRCGFTNSDLYDPMNIDGIKDVVEEQRSILKSSKFCFCRATGVDTVKLRQLIREFKQKTKSDYALIMVDLVSGLTDYMTGARGGNSSNSIELCMNRLEDIAKAENVHFVVIAQLNRKADDVHINSPEDVNKLRVTLADIKNSSAIGEKATTVLTLIRPKYYLDRYLKNNPDYTNYIETLPDELNVSILKDRDAPAGTEFKYLFDGKHYLLTPIREDNELTTNELDINEYD